MSTKPIGITDDNKLPARALAAIAASAELSRAFVAVRTADGKTLPAGTIVVITLDKTLAQVTASPVADIADISFQQKGA